MISFSSDIKNDDFRMVLDFDINDDDKSEKSEFDREIDELEKNLRGLGVITSDYVDVSISTESLSAKSRIGITRENAAKFASNFEIMFTSASNVCEAELTDGEQYIRFSSYDLSYYTLSVKLHTDGMTLETEREIPHYCLTDLFNEIYRLK